jgi:pullulanase/glycogen debranching enzyme
VRLKIYARPEDAMPARVVDLVPATYCTDEVWHVWVEGIRPGQLYAYRVDGPYQPEEGHRFNFSKLLLDPAATAITSLPDWDFAAARGYDVSPPERGRFTSTLDDAGLMPKCVFTHEHFDWRNDQPLRHSWCETVIYETHVRGVTAVELMPIHEFNEHQAASVNPQIGRPLGNCWDHDPQLPTTIEAGLDVDRKHPLQALHPRHRCGEFVGIHTAPRAPQLGQNLRRLQLNATKFSWRQPSHLTRKNPCSSNPHFR